MLTVSAPLAISLAVRSACVARGISLFELGTTAAELEAGGVYNASISGLVVPGGSAIRVRLQRAAAAIPSSAYKRIILLDALSALLLFAMPLNPMLLFLAVAMLVIQLNRQHMSCDGADEMTLVVLTASLVGSLGNAWGAAAWFLAGELCLSYLVAGSYKVASPAWKRGRALTQIVRTSAFGNAHAAKAFTAHPALATGLQLLTVAWECSFALSLLAPLPVTLTLMALGVGFHFSCAWVMGLNSFPWAFLACYPSVLYANAVGRALMGPDLGWAATAVAIAALQAVLYRRAMPTQINDRFAMQP